MANTHDDRPWWERWPDELTAVFSSLRAEGWSVAGVNKDLDRQQLCIELAELPDPPGWLRVRFEPATPTAAPTIFGPSGLKEHQHPIGGNLCLPRNAVDAVSAVRAAIELYQHPEAHPASSPEPRSAHLPFRSDTLLLPLDLPSGPWGTLTARARATPMGMWGWIDCMTVGPDSAPQRVVPADPTLQEALRDASPNLPLRRGVWVRTSEREYTLDGTGLLRLWCSVAPAEALAASEGLIEGAGDDPELLRRPVAPAVRLCGLVVPEEGPERGAWRDRLIVIVVRPRTTTAVVTQPLTLSTTRLPGLEVLPDKTVAVAGLGMIGGVVGLHLAQSGLGALRLLDPDHVEAGNLVRQPYEVQDIGTKKTRALRRRILRAAPWCQVDPEHFRDGFVQQLPRGELLRWLKGCDLLVLATSDKHAELYLSHLAKEVGVPIVGGWVGRGIWGGFAYRTLWGKSGCLNCIDQRYAEVVKVPEPPDAGDIFVAGCGHPTFPGTVVDGTTISDTIARLALTVLSPVYPPPPGDIATISIRSANEMGAVATAWQAFPPVADCSLCG